MQIGGMREFFSKITSLNVSSSVPNKTSSPALPAMTQQKQPARDSLLISEMGKKLSRNVENSASLIEKQKKVLPTSEQLVYDAMSKSIDILEKMRELAVTAQDKTLSDLDRVNLQIEIEELRGNLVVIPMNTMAAMQGHPPVERMLSVNSDIVTQSSSNGIYTFGDCSSVLGRMRERIINGQEWNVREAFSLNSFSGITHDDNGEEVLEVYQEHAWHVVDDKNVFTYSKDNSKYMDSGKKVPTVREKLELASLVVVMDAESADKGVKYLEQQIASVKKQREELPDLAFLEKIISPGVQGHKELLTVPASASYYLLGGKVYDSPYATQRLEKGDGRDISLIDAETAKDKMLAASGADNDAGGRYKYSVPKLSAEICETTTPIVPKIKYIKGVGALTKEAAMALLGKFVS